MNLELVNKNFANFFSEYQNQKVVVALSGGRDSVALLDLVVKHSLDLSNLLVVHVNHKVRTDGTSEEDAIFCQNLAGKYKVDFRLIELQPSTTPSYDELRLLRREKINQEAAIWAGGEDFFVFVAHSLTDQAETVLMRAMTSPTVNSLKAMAVTDYNIVRPLMPLGFYRDDCATYLELVGQEWREDPNNHLSKRGKIRAILQQLNEVDHRTLPNLNKIAEYVREEEDAWEEFVDKELEKPFTQKQLSALPVALARRVLRKQAEQQLDRNMAMISRRLEEVLAVKPGSKLQLGGNSELLVKRKGFLEFKNLNE